MSNNTRFIKDVIYGVIKIDEPWVFEILNSLEFERLRHIHQLGISYINFPNATHTRFAHSLGTYELVKRLANQINLVNAKLRQELLAAALLHDIGHGPFSHFFETITHIHHEVITSQIILDSHTQINQILKKYSIDPHNVVKILKHQHKYQILNELISSQIDADRMDYLSRDAHFTGACYGLIDSPLLIQWMCIHQNKICFDRKAISSIENFLISRYHMYVDVYEQPKIVALEEIIRKIFKRFKFLYKKQKIVDFYHAAAFFKPWLEDKKWNIKDYLLLNDDVFNLFLSQMQYEKDEYLKKGYQLFKNFKNDQYVIYSATSKEAQQQLLKFKNKYKNYDLYVHKIHIHDIKVYDKLTQPIHIFDKTNKKVQHLDQCSSIIKHLSGKIYSQNLLIFKH